ncbi:hypothetical protein FHU33_1906 [Blastococcus colisei]|uniref:Uncharacterized protein n=1 Tax=Blastococcus colisei TaxID=1564162 RepID=A0A543PEI1_9ACTN|nr:hypothetical protein [Blastococcus colisei]TQN42504.1 hypothetical protein FHU33_1906 [Blastococcus colisei]
MATSLLQLPGVLAWRARQVAGRGARFVGAAGLVLGGGLVALFAFGQSHGEGVALAGSEPIDPALQAAYTRSDSSAALGIGLLLALLGFHLGWALFFGALRRCVSPDDSSSRDDQDTAGAASLIFPRPFPRSSLQCRPETAADL